MLHAPARHSRHRPAAGAAPAPGSALPPGAAILPYDYAATFPLSGRTGHILQDVINVSPDGVFVATAIGYGFEEDRARELHAELRPLSPNNPPRSAVVPGDLTLGEIPIDALLGGFRVNPALHAMVFRSDATETNSFAPARVRGLSDAPVAVSVAVQEPVRTGLLQRVAPNASLSFLFSMVDSTTGRELQDEPTHNIASLGAADGQRPFRQLPTPLTFLPRSSIRVQVVERTEGVHGTLFIVLYGYKILTGNSVCPEPVLRRLTGPAETPLETVGRPDERVTPFDQVATIPLDGAPGRWHERELSLSIEGAFVITSIGYGLLAEPPEVALQWNRVGDVLDPALRTELEGMRNSGRFDLARVPLRLLPPDALIDGVRLEPELVRLALQNNGVLASSLPLDLGDQLFTRLNASEDVSFRYAFFEGGRGRELQSQPLHNLAGLGSADGQRPFKRLSRALVLLPRSTLRLAVQEFSGRGTLYFALQGYRLDPTAASRRGGRS